MHQCDAHAAGPTVARLVALERQPLDVQVGFDAQVGFEELAASVACSSSVLA